MTESDPAWAPAGLDRRASAFERPLIVVHVGMHKTGSTSMQAYLSEQGAALREAGYVYPRAGRYADQHSALPRTYLPGHFVLPDEVGPAPREDILAGIAREVGPRESALLSSEVFWEVLAYQPDDFDAIHRRLQEQWRVVLLYFARDPHGKSWSSVKHLGRMGPLPDVIGTYRRDRELTEAAEARLRQAHPDAVRVPYDGRDSVRQLLEQLSDPKLVAAGGRTPDQVAALGRLLQQRRPQPRRRRINSDFRNPYGAAVSLCVAEVLVAKNSADLRYERLPRLYHRLFRTADDGWSSRGLPTEKVLGERLRTGEARATERLFTDAERRGVLAGLSSRRVRARAAAARCASSLALAADALRESLGD